MIKVPKQTFVPLSNDELAKLLKVAKSEGNGVMYEFTLATGVRLGELLALSWNDIDYDKQTATINKNVSSFVSGKECIEQMSNGVRTITLTSNLLTKLKEHKKKQLLIQKELGEQYSELNLVFPNRNGGIQKPSVVRTRFNILINKADITQITFHDLRKMHAIFLIKAGVPYEIIKSRLGHKQTESTIKCFNQIVK